MTSTTRTLGAVRLSKPRGDDDPSSSPERQRLAIEAAAPGEVIDWATDLGASATKLSPFERPDLGEWLRHSDRFDAICWARLDRAVRSMSDLHDLARWATTNQKLLVFASGPGGAPLTLDMRQGDLDPVAHLVMTILAFAAQMEAHTIGERMRNMKSYLRNTGQFIGGELPYWLTLDDERNIVLHPHNAPRMREIVDRVIAGEPQSAICRDLNAREIESGRGGKWQQPVMAWMLRNPALRGYAVYTNNATNRREPVRNDNGEPVMMGEALIESHDEWAKLQHALDVQSRPKTRRRDGDARLLSQLVFCGWCEKSVHYRAQPQRSGKVDIYLRCKDSKGETKCWGKSLPAGVVESFAEKVFLDTVGPSEIHKLIHLPPESHAEERQAAEDALSYLVDAAANAPASSRHIYTRQIEQKQAQLERLAAQPELPARTELKPTGETYGEVWNAAETGERRQLLIDGGFRLYVLPLPETNPERAREQLESARGDDGAITIGWHPDIDFGLGLIYPVDVLGWLRETRGPGG